MKAAHALPMGNVWAATPWNPACSTSSTWPGAVPFELAARYHVTPEFSWTNFSGSGGSSTVNGWDGRLQIGVKGTLDP